MLLLLCFFIQSLIILATTSDIKDAYDFAPSYSVERVWCWAEQLLSQTKLRAH